MTSDLTSVEVTCVTLPKDHCVQVRWKYIKVYGYSDPFCKNLNQRSLTPRQPLTPHLLRSHVWLYPRIIVSKSHRNTSMYVDTVINFANYQLKVIDSKMTFDPTSVEVLCVTLPKDNCVQVPWKYIKVCGYSDLFLQKKNLEPRSLTPRWPLTPHLLRSHVWLYPRIIVSKSHEKTSKYVDTVNLFSKTWIKGHWPLDDLWLHICWGHMCDSTQGSLCPSPMGNINVCGYSDQFCKLPHTYTYCILHTTYTLRTESVIT